MDGNRPSKKKIESVFRVDHLRCSSDKQRANRDDDDDDEGGEGRGGIERDSRREKKIDCRRVDRRCGLIVRRRKRENGLGEYNGFYEKKITI